VSVQRIYVHADLEPFLDRFAARVKALSVGDPHLPETEVGPLILPREADRVSAWIEEAVSSGAKLIGGRRINSTTLVHRSSSTRLATPKSRASKCSAQ
jgi:acyl-CoA reductase-like NAD-dependent aldehyde dehydrogenase